MEENNSETTLKDILREFHNRVVDDPRMGPTHISLYIAILHFTNEQNFQSPISVFSKELMKHAKISGIATYTKCILELKQFGFINYIPSFNPLLGSLIYLLKLNKE